MNSEATPQAANAARRISSASLLAVSAGPASGGPRRLEGPRTSTDTFSAFKTSALVVALAMAMTLSLPAVAQGPDTATRARALVPLLNSVKERLRPRTGVFAPGNPQPSPFTGTVTTLVSFGVGKKEVPVDPKVVDAMNRLLAWNPDDKSQTAEAVLFDHWLTELTLKAAHLGVLNCDAACVIQRFPAPDEAFGKSRHEREQTRDELLLEALTDAVEELEP